MCAGIFPTAVTCGSLGMDVKADLDDTIAGTLAIDVSIDVR